MILNEQGPPRRSYRRLGVKEAWLGVKVAAARTGPEVGMQTEGCLHAAARTGLDHRDAKITLGSWGGVSLREV